jgi:serine phosphatase RsbU (regulator of sigma subunit)
MEGAEYDAASIDIPEDSLLCFYSDGIPEAARGEEFYGDARFMESLGSRRRLPVDQAVEEILGDLRSFLGDGPPSDDVTLLLVRREAGPTG